MSKKYTRQLTIDTCFVCKQPIEAEITGTVEVGEGRVMRSNVTPAGFPGVPRRATVDVQFVPTKLVIHHECGESNG